jgi:ribosomal protein S18 acetylase RimI-like enzyme
MTGPEAGGTSEAWRIRPFEEADIPFALEQTTREGWDSTRESFLVLLEHDRSGNLVAEAESRPVGMVTTTRHRATGWVGNLIVEPRSRRRGLGERLMEMALRQLEAAGVTTHRLEADPAGIGIYRRLGFEDEFESPRFRLGRASPVRSEGCRRLSRDDLEALAQLDAAAFGDDRARLLNLILASAHTAYRWPETGPLRGYVVVQRAAVGVRLGPWVAQEPAGAQALLQAALAGVQGECVIVALPGPNVHGCELLRKQGFAPSPSSLRMVRGAATAQGTPEAVYGLASGAVG